MMHAAEGRPSSPRPPTATPPPAQTKPSTAQPPKAQPTKAQLLKAGLCSDDGEIQQVRTVVVDGRSIYEATCAMFAYQGSYGYAWADGLRPFRTPDGQVVAALGLPTIDPELQSLTWVSKGRGAGGCGHFYRYSLAGGEARLVEHRSSPCTDGPGELDPTKWPLVP